MGKYDKYSKEELISIIETLVDVLNVADTGARELSEKLQIERRKNEESQRSSINSQELDKIRILEWDNWLIEILESDEDTYTWNITTIHGTIYESAKNIFMNEFECAADAIAALHDFYTTD